MCVAQHVFLHLAHGVSGQRIDDNHRFRPFELGERACEAVRHGLCG